MAIMTPTQWVLPIQSLNNGPMVGGLYAIDRALLCIHHWASRRWIVDRIVSLNAMHSVSGFAICAGGIRGTPSAPWHFSVSHAIRYRVNNVIFPLAVREGAAWIGLLWHFSLGCLLYRPGLQMLFSHLLITCDPLGNLVTKFQQISSARLRDWGEII